MPVALFKEFLSSKFIMSVEKVSEYDQKVPQSQTADQATGHLQ